MHLLGGQTKACQLYSNLWKAGRTHSYVNLEIVPSDPDRATLLHPRTVCFLGLLIPEQFLTERHAHVLAYLQ